MMFFPSILLILLTHFNYVQCATTCNRGQYLDNTNCYNCEPGYYCPDGVRQIPCSPGTYQDDYQSSSCASCSSGYYTTLYNSTKCLICPIGKMCPNNDRDPITCPADITLCPKGSECPRPDQGPLLCRPGTYSYDYGAYACQTCTSGTYTTQSGTVSCVACPKGNECPRADQPPSPCRPGSFAGSDGLTSCTACSQNYYATKSGQVACQLCPVGFDCLQRDQDPRPCPAGYSRDYSQTSCTKCSSGTYAKNISSSRCDSCPAGNECPSADQLPSPCRAGTYASTKVINELIRRKFDWEFVFNWESEIVNKDLVMISVFGNEIDFSIVQLIINNFHFDYHDNKTIDEIIEAFAEEVDMEGIEYTIIKLLLLSNTKFHYYIFFAVDIKYQNTIDIKLETLDRRLNNDSVDTNFNDVNTIQSMSTITFERDTDSDTNSVIIMDNEIDNNPIPQFHRLYPYSRFDGYANEGHTQNWTMIVLENAYIKLWICPEIGGKIWGAREKSTGKDFIYFNHVVKFRDVAMRGPWTSGGIEWNFGIIGHSPSCSAPVDYFWKKNENKQIVSCTVGTTDWSSQTTWRVEICLEKDKTYFQTRTWWFNNTAQDQSYYQWTNVGIKTNGNLEYIFPGNRHLGHDGRHFSWPYDELNKHQISFYNQNDFGEYKSYHVYGTITNFWGCYWHEDNFGFGHYSLYDDKVGKKIWIWGLSRYGMIWEDLLTDEDGQYSEVQAGRLFNQTVASSSKTPFKHRTFSPYTLDKFDEYWFPIKNIQGLTHACKQLSFKINEYSIQICANEYLNQTLMLKFEHDILFKHKLDLKPMQTIDLKFPKLQQSQLKQVSIYLNDELIYDALQLHYVLKRPVNVPQNFDINSLQSLSIQGQEWERQRLFQFAVDTYKKCLQIDQNYIPALNGLAGIYYRHTKYNDAIELLIRVLSIDTYNSRANYLYGLTNVKLGNIYDARDGFSLSSQSIDYRCSSYIELSKIEIREKQFNKALDYIEKALDNDKYNWQALQLKVLLDLNYVDIALEQNPLNHMFRYEKYKQNADSFQSGIQTELKHQVYLELATWYYDLKKYSDSIQILTLALSASVNYPLIQIWKAFLLDKIDNNSQLSNDLLNEAVLMESDYVCPHRQEDVDILKWAIEKNSNWKLKYYLALLNIHMLQDSEALTLLLSCSPADANDHYYPFYIVRAMLLKKLNNDTKACENDLIIATETKNWRTVLTLSKFYENNNNWLKALEIVRSLYHESDQNYYASLQLAKCLMYTKEYENAIDLMKNKFYILPNEGTLLGRYIWRETHLYAALETIIANNYSKALIYINEARKWPENLGVGKPYDVDERLEDFLELCCIQQNHDEKLILEKKIMNYRINYPHQLFKSSDLLTIFILKKQGYIEKAKELMDKWLKQDNSMTVRWSEAVLNNDKTGTSAICSETEETIDSKEALPYETVFEDREFSFIKQLYQVGLLRL
ncbi:unnamed protein product [Didymodactylos carnosus]|uniref:Uncharacterized protein n=1 Tax=Didymodactylos carnosus TaxID=1234261 RepID=A0A8S2CQI8_9BILA|nr:unnamed protein product [Didymodactylos carnosus]CAF3514832.1 unnamed protein product [Didymodactylos carnosus]